MRPEIRGGRMLMSILGWSVMSRWTLFGERLKRLEGGMIRIPV